MAEATKQVGPPTESGAGREPKWRDLGLWLVTLAWGTSAYIYGWLLIGGFEKREYWNREYWNQIYEVWSFANFWLPLICGIVVAAFSFFGTLAKKPAEGEGRQLFRIVVAVLPALFLVSALAVLVLTLATYNDDWREARQGIATAFAALIAAVGVIVSVAVSYKTGEENRLAQQENLKTQLESQQENLKTQLESQQKNLETQLEHQRTLEVEKGAREQQKLDAELIKNLNDRLHEVIARRYSSGDDKDTSGLVSASYFQLASLYKDWETLSKTSDLIALQKESQQRNILKLLFGVYQESDEKGTSDEKNSSDRSEVDIRTLNSVIQDIFPLSEGWADNESKTSDGQQGTFDLSYLDLRGPDLSRRDLRGANLIGARLEQADLGFAHLKGANLRDAHLERAHLDDVHLERAYLWGAHLEGANLRDAHLERAHLDDAHLKGANLRDAHLDMASFFIEFVDNPQDPEVRGRIINQLKACRILPAEDELLKVKGFDQALVDQIIQAHKEE